MLGQSLSLQQWPVFFLTLTCGGSQAWIIMWAAGDEGIGPWQQTEKGCGLIALQVVGMNHPLESFVAPDTTETARQSCTTYFQMTTARWEEPHWYLNPFQPPQVWFLPSFTVSAGKWAKATQNWICSWCSSCSHSSSPGLWVGPSEEPRLVGKFGSWSAS